MIDFCNIVTDIKRPKDLGNFKRGHVSYCGIDFYRLPQGYYKGRTGNMGLKIIGEVEPKLIISNSIHKYYANGINWNDFTLSNFYESIEMLSDEFNTNLLDANVSGKIEFAVNLNEDPNTIYPYSQNYLSWDSEPMKYKHEVYGSRFELKSRRIKQYDPTKKIEISKEQTPKPKTETLRCELVTGVSEYRKRKMKLTKVSDLFNPIFIEGMGQELRATFSRIRYSQGIPKGVTQKELEAYLIFDGMTPEEHALYKKLTKAGTYKNRRKYYKAYIDRCDKEVNLSQELADKIHEKWTELSSS